MIRSIAAGTPEPLGVTPCDGGVNVAVFSAHAEWIEFCLFDATGEREIARLPLSSRSGDIHHAWISNVPAGSRYGLRAHGPYDPGRGHRFNANKLLVDPFATALDRRFQLHPSLYGFDCPDGSGFSSTDSAPHVPKAIVTARDSFSIAGERPGTGWPETILYELGIRGFSKRNPAIPEHLRGTFAGLAHRASLDHLRRIGVTAVEIMPAAAWIDERHLSPLGLTNAWGYNPVSFMVPEPKLAPGGWEEVRTTVAACHEAGLEVILDIVLNHSGEGDELGPTLSFRGLDNASYYRLHPDDPSRYINDMGCGNCLALDRGEVVRLAMDTLRLWASTGIDGFRFDLATAMGRRPEGFDPDAPLITAIRQDPALRDLKLIAEAWDIGPGGYQVGRFPVAFKEWNDRYRDDARRFWRGDAGGHRDMATRLTGSHDMFSGKGTPSSSINFIAAHDGFTLADIVAYEQKHNLANGEDNRDGTNANHAWNNGIEGTTDDPDIQALRARDQLNLLATLLFSRGTPMLSMGFEMGHSQQGNNNAYAQDNATTWLDWSQGLGPLAQAAEVLIALRKALPHLKDDRFLSGTTTTLDGFADALWRRRDGTPAQQSDWTGDAGETLILDLACAMPEGTLRAVLVLHRGRSSTELVLPQAQPGYVWVRKADTALAPSAWGAQEAEAGTTLAQRSVTVFVEARGKGISAGPSDALVNRLAADAGIVSDWWDHAGVNHPVSLETKRTLLSSMGFDPFSASACHAAIHHLAALKQNAPPPVPGSCFLAPGLKPAAGVTAQLYALRRAGDQGIGDLTTLSLAGAAAAQSGMKAFGINPLHALFPGDCARASPYHPSDRRFLDEIYIDLDLLTDLPGGEAVAQILSERSAALAAKRARSGIDYGFVRALKLDALQALFAGFLSARGTASAARQHADFSRFQSAGGEALHRFATFRALELEHGGRSWRDWPEAFRAPGAASVRAFAAQHENDIAFACFLQWLAERQLAGADASVRAAGLTHGLLRDLAVGCAPDGAEIWANRDAFASGVSIGAPPDPFSATGQVWNLPPLAPQALFLDEFGFFRSLLSANMRHAGLLRIDHVLGLGRLFWVPDGATASEGAYVAYPLQHLLAVVAEESRAHRCTIVGEDLGTVPDGLRQSLSDRAILSYRVLWFEREGESYRPPQSYPRLAAACVATHDLATIAGWWEGTDLDEKAQLGLLEKPDAARVGRAAEKQALIDLALAQGALAQAPDFAEPLTDACAAALHGLVAASPALFAFAQLDDLASETVAVNLPGTDRERPNWRRRLAEPVESLFNTPRARAILAALAQNR